FISPPAIPDDYLSQRRVRLQLRGEMLLRRKTDAAQQGGETRVGTNCVVLRHYLREVQLRGPVLDRLVKPVKRLVEISTRHIDRGDLIGGDIAFRTQLLELRGSCARFRNTPHARER